MGDLRRHIGNGIKKGHLPNVDCLVTWFASGRGEICVVCWNRILGSEVSVECEVPEGPPIWFHGPCYTEWLSVRRA
jgi:hypothetical protein